MLPSAYNSHKCRKAKSIQKNSLHRLPKLKVWGRKNDLQANNNKTCNTIANSCFFVSLVGALTLDTETFDEEWHHRPQSIRWNHLWRHRRLTEAASGRSLSCRLMALKTQQSQAAHQVSHRATKLLIDDTTMESSWRVAFELSFNYTQPIWPLSATPFTRLVKFTKS